MWGVSQITFPVVVSVDVEGVEQLVVVVGQQVQTSGPGFNDIDDLLITTEQLKTHSVYRFSKSAYSVVSLQAFIGQQV